MHTQDELLRRVLSGVGVDERGAVWSELGGGLSNRSFKVDLAGNTVVVRLREAPAEFQLDLVQEATLLRAVAAAGIGPKLVGIDIEHNALVMQHVAASPWDRKAARETRNIGRIAGLLLALHRLEVPCRDFAPQRYATRYVEIVSSRGHMSREDSEWARELIDLTRDFEQRFRSRVVCHNDLVAENILDAGTLALIDFEYAVRADPIVDLASLAAMNQYGAVEQRRLLDAYLEAGGVRYQEAELDTVMRLLRLMTYFWALCAASNRGREEIEARFADRSQLEKGRLTQ